MSNAYHALKTDEEKKKFKEEKAVLLEELRDVRWLSKSSAVLLY
jgi:hypothetical protein